MGKWGHYKYYCHLRSFIKQDKNKLIRKSLAAFTKKTCGIHRNPNNSEKNVQAPEFPYNLCMRHLDRQASN